MCVCVSENVWGKEGISGEGGGGDKERSYIDVTEDRLWRRRAHGVAWRGGR